MPVTLTRSLKLLATVTASWPVIASATSRVSCGLAAACTSATSAISSSSIARRPAVSSMTTSKPSRRPICIARLAIATGGLADHDRQRLDADLLAENGELLLRGRAAHVERGHQHALALLLEQALGDLGGGGGLARALQADHQDRHRRRRVEIEAGLDAFAGGERLDQLVMDELHHHLAGRHRLDDAARRSRLRAPWRRNP